MIYINSRFLAQSLTGVQRFATELSFQLKEILGEKIKFVAPPDIIQKEIAKELNAEIIGSHTGYFWEQVELPQYLEKQGSPPLINFCSVAPLFYKNNIIAVHDITWVRFPETYSKSFRLVYNFLIPRLCKRAKHLITVSEFSKNELSHYYKLPKEKITIIPNAVNSIFKPVFQENLYCEMFFLAVSSVKANKNFPVILSSFEKLQKRIPEAKLFVIGDLKGTAFNHINLTRYEKSPNIKMLGRVSDEDLIRYYSNAVAFIFPSLYEGFGIPALEAQACGCPVISSNTSSMPEVLLDSVLYCNPTDSNAFAQNMYNLATNSVLRQELIRKGFDNVQRFSWKTSAEKICSDILMH